jgi:hypothetical protein
MKSATCFLTCLLFTTHWLFAQKTDSPFPGERGADLDTYAWENIWDRTPEGFLDEFVRVPRDSVVAFALYTHDQGVLKMTAQLYPLQKREKRRVRLELLQEGEWQEVQKVKVQYPGWSAHFRLEDWDDSRDVPYRVRHGDEAMFEGLIRKDPKDKAEILVASFSCNSNKDRGMRSEIVGNVLRKDPDLLFFAGDQSYDHKQHTAAWLLWGRQFRELIKDRPVITIPDDHDIGQGNLWGEGGKKAATPAGDDGGYYYPAGYVKMVERMQTSHLPDPYDPTPIEQGIGVYYTRLRVGGVDFAIIEDRKFKSGPKGKIPQMGPRPDHIREAGYDPSQVNLPELSLLGERQLDFLNNWAQDWTGSQMKAVLSQTAFCGAVHLHGNKENRLLADLDSNGWPQHGRDAALRAIRSAYATHLCGDQHLSVIVKHGIEEHRDGPYAFTNPAIVNSYYGRWWWPEDEEAGGGTPIDNALPWTGDYQDGLYNKITMIAYANPEFGDIKTMSQNQNDPEDVLGDGFGLIRFNKKSREITYESWPRYADVREGDQAQYPGWPFTFRMRENDGRQVTGYLAKLSFANYENPVVQVIHEESGEVVYTLRVRGRQFRPWVYEDGNYTIKAGKDKADLWSKEQMKTGDESQLIINF